VKYSIIFIILVVVSSCSLTQVFRPKHGPTGNVGKIVIISAKSDSIYEVEYKAVALPDGTQVCSLMTKKPIKRIPK